MEHARLSYQAQGGKWVEALRSASSWLDEGQTNKRNPGDLKPRGGAAVRYHKTWLCLHGQEGDEEALGRLAGVAAWLGVGQLVNVRGREREKAKTVDSPRDASTTM